MTRIFVLGSCVSRDAFSFGEQNNLELADYFARTSLASLGGKPAPLAFDLSKVPVGWRRRMVQADHEKSVLPLIAKTQFDILLVDLIDERFNLLENKDGSLVTFSAEYGAAVSYPLSGRLLRSGSLEHITRWRQGFQRLVATLQKTGKIESLRVNRVFWASKTADGLNIDGVEPERISAANVFLKDRYKDIEDILGGAVFYDYPEELFRAAKYHKWGVSPFHYVDGFYKAAMKKLVEEKILPKAPDFSRTIEEKSWDVELDSSGEEWVARIIGYPDKLSAEFAFYLKYGNNLIAKRWYSNCMSANFSAPTIPGDYHAIGFVRAKADAEPEIRQSPLVHKGGHPLYDLDQWKQPVFDYSRDSAWPEKHQLSNGIHRFAIGPGDTIDVRLDGIERLRDDGVVLVCFGGAVPKRNTRSAPFFFGVGIAEKLGVPLLAVADPVLRKSPSLALGWYAGGQKFIDLPLQIAKVLDAFSANYKSRFVVFGGSGGGFATISVLGHLRSIASGFVWNPQTSIGKYWSVAVKNYLDTAFPLSSGQADLSHMSRLESSGISHDLVCERNAENHPLLYLQNRSDKHHMEHHARPYAVAHQVKRVSNTVYAADNGLVLWFGNWGKGHAVPPAPMILSILDGLVSGKAPQTLASQLEEGEGHDLQFDL